MIKRGLALSVVLGLTTVVRAGATIEVVPGASANAFNPCGAYGAGEVVTVEVFLSQTPADVDHYLRFAQFDMTDSDSMLGLPSSVDWVAADRHFAFLDNQGGADRRLSNTFLGDVMPIDPMNPDLGLDTSRQFLLPGDGSSVKVAEFDVTMPGAPGSYDLDLMNSSESHVDRGAQLRYGFSIDGTEAITVWRADSGDLTGGTFSFDVVDQAVVSSVPGFNKSLWRTARNAFTLTLNAAVAAPDPGEIEVRELMPGGAFGADLSGTFTYSMNANVLTIQDNAATLQNKTWYAIQNVGGWAEAGNFRAHAMLQMGDANDDGRVLPNDLSFINSFIPMINAAPDVRANINNDGNVLPNDLSVANSFIPALAVPKPSGHDCQ